MVTVTLPILAFILQRINKFLMSIFLMLMKLTCFNSCLRGLL